MSETDKARQRFLDEFEHLTRFGGGTGFPLGVWGGWGIHATTTMERRAAAGLEAVDKLDAFIAELTDFRTKLAEAVGEHAQPPAAR